jgi:hypothetical protein
VKATTKKSEATPRSIACCQRRLAPCPAIAALAVYAPSARVAVRAVAMRLQGNGLDWSSSRAIAMPPWERRGGVSSLYVLALCPRDPLKQPAFPGSGFLQAIFLRVLDNRLPHAALCFGRCGSASSATAIMASMTCGDCSSSTSDMVTAHINQLRVAAKAAREQVNFSLASIQSSLLLLAAIERSNPLRPIAP